MEKIWLQSYEAGVPAEIDISRYESIISVFEESVQKYGAQTAFENMGKGPSYAELAQQAQQFASFLQNTLKLPRGERVAVIEGETHPPNLSARSLLEPVASMKSTATASKGTLAPNVFRGRCKSEPAVTVRDPRGASRQEEGQRVDSVKFRDRQ